MISIALSPYLLPQAVLDLPDLLLVLVALMPIRNWRRPDTDEISL